MLASQNLSRQCSSDIVAPKAGKPAKKFGCTVLFWTNYRQLGCGQTERWGLPLWNITITPTTRS